LVEHPGSAHRRAGARPDHYAGDLAAAAQAILSSR
jgi:hypothetical protein